MFKKALSTIIILTFLMQSVYPSELLAQAQPSIVPNISISSISPNPVFNGIKIYPQEPFRFDFITDTEDSFDEQDVMKLVKYFMASLTVPEGDLWVNLSPYEPDHIVLFSHNGHCAGLLKL